MPSPSPTDSKNKPSVTFPPKSSSIVHFAPDSTRRDSNEEDDEEDANPDFDREMSLADSLLNGGSGGKSRRGEKGHPFRSLTPRRIGLIAGTLLLVIFWFGKGTGTGRDSDDLAGGGEGRELLGGAGGGMGGGGGAGGQPGGVKAGGQLGDDTIAAAPVAPHRPVQVDELPANIEDTDGPGLGLPPSSPQKQAGTTTSGPCTPPPGQKPSTYALMIDAGSTGSRLHLYTFSHCDPTPGALPKLEHEGFFTTKPGLSAYSGRPKEAAESLRGLMEHAMKDIPAKERACSPVAVKATAGLRMLGVKESTDILDEVERWLKSEWPFSVIKDGVVIMDGRDEGVYAWITINFLLGLIGPDNADPSSSAAIMDLGGASTQIVFEPTFSPASTSKLAEGDHVYDLTFSGSPHVLYQHSHLGYGLMQARRAVHNLVAFSHVWSSAPKKGKEVVWESLTKKTKIHHPCLFKGETKVVTLDPPGRETVEVTMQGTGAGFEACRRVVEVMLAKDAVCEEEPCAFGGVYQPRLGEVFSAGKVWALSYFYDRIAPLGLTSPFRLSELRTLTSNVCAGRSSPTWSRFKGNEEAIEELRDRPEYCLDLTFMYSLLSLGYELEEEREIYMGKKVGQVELGWALGAALNMETGSLSCRAE